MCEIGLLLYWWVVVQEEEEAEAEERERGEIGTSHWLAQNNLTRPTCSAIKGQLTHHLLQVTITRAGTQFYKSENDPISVRYLGNIEVRGNFRTVLP